MAKSNRELFAENVARRMRLIYKGAFQQFEKHFPDQTKERVWSVVRNTILNISNDQIRLIKSDLDNFDIRRSFSVHKPFEGILVHADPQAMRVLGSTEFGFYGDRPFIKVTGDRNDHKVLCMIRDELGAGMVDDSEENFVYYIVGTQECIDKVIPVFDKLTFISGIGAEYRAWKLDVLDIYLGDRDDSRTSEG